MSMRWDERATALLEGVTSPVTGIVRRIVALPSTGSRLPFHHVQVHPARYSALSCSGDIAQSGGSDLSLETCIIKAAFEAIERYCGSFMDYSRTLYAPPTSDFLQAGINYQRFADFQYEPEDWPFYRRQEDRPIHWVMGRSLVSGKRRGVPATLVPVPSVPPTPFDTLGPTFSTGFACGWDWESACRSGLLEVVERDAFAIAWAHRVRHSALAPVPGTRLEALAQTCRDAGVQGLHFVDVRTDVGIPVVACTLIHEAAGHRYPAVGLSAHPVQAVACLKALSEAVSEYERLRLVLESGTQRWRYRGSFHHVRDFPDHGELFLNEELQDELDFLTDDRDAVAVEGDLDDRDGASLLDLVERVSDFCGEIIALELTTRDVAPLGVRVVKIVVPKMVPLHAHHRFPYLGHDRLWTVGGRDPEGIDNQDPSRLNAVPHPFS